MMHEAATRLTMMASRRLRRLIFCIKLFTTGNRSDKFKSSSKTADCNISSTENVIEIGLYHAKTKYMRKIVASSSSQHHQE